MNHGTEGNFLRCSVIPAKVNKVDGLGWGSFLKVKFQWENPLGGEGVCPAAKMETWAQLRASAAPPPQPQLGFSG